MSGLTIAGKVKKANAVLNECSNHLIKNLDLTKCTLSKKYRYPRDVLQTPKLLEKLAQDCEEWANVFRMWSTTMKIATETKEEKLIAWMIREAEVVKPRPVEKKASSTRKKSSRRDSELTMDKIVDSAFHKPAE